MSLPFLGIFLGAETDEFEQHWPYFVLIPFSVFSPGDRVVSVNGESVLGRPYSEVVQMVKATGEALQLMVVPKEDDILQMVRCLTLVICVGSLYFLDLQYFSEMAQNPETNRRSSPAPSSLSSVPSTPRTLPR